MKTKRKKPVLVEHAVIPVYSKYSGYPSNGLTPARLANILKEADSGNLLRQAELFEEMEEKDPHLFSQLQTRKNAVTGLDFEIIEFSEEERDKQIAEFIREELNGLGKIEELFLELLDAVGKGIAIMEILWKLENGSVRIAEIKPKHQKNFFWDGKDILKVRTKESPNGAELPENKFIIHEYKAKSGHISRGGVLRVVAWMYLFKNYTLKDWISFCEIYGMPLRLGKYSQSASEDDKNALMQALIQIGTDAAGMVPDGTEIEFVEASKTSSADVYEKLARYCDEQISKAILGQTLTSDSGGSHAQSKTHNEVRHDLTAADCKALAATIRQDLIRPLVLFNFGEERRIPYLKFDFEEADDLKETVDIYRTLICEIGLPVSREHLYKKFSIPKPEAGEAIVSPETLLRKTAEPPVSLKAESIPEWERLALTAKKKDQAEIDSLIEKAKEVGKKGFDYLDTYLQSLSKKELDEIVAELKDTNRLTEVITEDKTLENVLANATLLADLKGRTVERDVSVTLEVETDSFREAVEFFKDKVAMTSKDFYKLSDKYKSLAFTVATYSKLDIVQQFKDELLNAIENGTTQKEFQHAMNTFLQDKGYKGITDFQAENIFRTNIQTAYQVGHYKAMQEVKDIRPYWKYVAVEDRHTRPSHAAMNGRIFHADHPIWGTWYPPNGFKCRCTVVTLSEDDIETKGLTVSEKLPDTVAGEGGKTVQMIPDPHFATNPAKTYYEPDTAKLSPEIREIFKKITEKHPL